MRRIFPLLLWTGLGLMPWAAHADVWGYVDTEGMSHFADRKVDSRYQGERDLDGSTDDDEPSLQRGEFTPGLLGHECHLSVVRPISSTASPDPPAATTR